MEKRYENEEMEIDLLELFYVLRSKILAILMCGIIFGGLAFGYAKYLVTPQYTSSSMMLVLTKETTLSSLADLQIGSQLTKDYSLLITSRPVLTEVVDNLDLDMDYKALKNCITVTNQDDTRILQIAVQYPDAKMNCQMWHQNISENRWRLHHLRSSRPAKCRQSVRIRV